MMVLSSCTRIEETTVIIPEISETAASTTAETAEAVSFTETEETEKTEVSAVETTSETAAETTVARLRLSPDAQQNIISEPYCRASAMYCIEDDIVLYADNIHTRTSPASLTKLLTASTAFRYMEPGTVCTVGTEQSMVGEGSSICYVRPGHELTLHDLVTGMLMASGNDAA